MDLPTIKIKLYHKCLEKQKDIADSAFSAMEEAQKAANEYGPPKDRYDSFRTQLLRKRDLYAEQYEKALKDLDYLTKINPEKVNKTISANTLVITNIQNFYVSIGIGKVMLDENVYYVISPVAPIFQVLRDKIPGETIVFNGKKITIKDVA